MMRVAMHEGEESQGIQTPAPTSLVEACWGGDGGPCNLATRGSLGRWESDPALDGVAQGLQSTCQREGIICG